MAHRAASREQLFRSGHADRHDHAPELHRARGRRPLAPAASNAPGGICRATAGASSTFATNSPTPGSSSSIRAGKRPRGNGSGYASTAGISLLFRVAVRSGSTRSRSSSGACTTTCRSGCRRRSVRAPNLAFSRIATLRSYMNTSTSITERRSSAVSPASPGPTSLAAWSIPMSDHSARIAAAPRSRSACPTTRGSNASSCCAATRSANAATGYGRGEVLSPERNRARHSPFAAALELVCPREPPPPNSGLFGRPIIPKRRGEEPLVGLRSRSLRTVEGVTTAYSRPPVPARSSRPPGCWTAIPTASSVRPGSRPSL